MVIKIKVSEIAKDLGKSNKDIIEILDAYCDGPAKKAGTALSDFGMPVKNWRIM